MAALVRTPSGGAHLYAPGSGQGNGSLRGQHIDFRSAGGYVLAPPSAVGGRPYVVVSHQAHGDPIDWAKVREHLEPQRERQWEPGAAGLMHRFRGSVAGPMAPKQEPAAGVRRGLLAVASAVDQPLQPSGVGVVAAELSMRVRVSVSSGTLSRGTGPGNPPDRPRLSDSGRLCDRSLAVFARLSR